MKKLFCVILSLFLVFTAFSLSASASMINNGGASGTYGTIEWVYRRSDMSMTFSGTGSVPGYNEDFPWKAYAAEIHTVIVGEGITTLNRCAFYGIYSNLKTVVLPESLTDLSYGAFWNCAKLETVNIPSKITVIPERAFCNCKSLKNIDIPEGITDIEYEAFSGDTSLESFVIPESAVNIGMDILSGCSSLEYVSLPQSMTVLPHGIFWNCKSLETVELPGNLKSFGDYPFLGSGLKSIFIPESVTEIKGTAFSGSSNLEEIFLPKTLTFIEYEAFSGCSSLKRIYFDGILENWDPLFEGNSETAYRGKSEINGAVLYCDYENSYPVNDTAVTKSGTYGDLNWSVGNDGTLTVSGNGEMKDFYMNEFHFVQSMIAACPWNDYRLNLKSLVIEEGVTRIGAYNFCASTYKKVVVPDSVTSIGKSAFHAATEMRFIYIGSGVTSIEKNAFYGCEKLKTIIYNGTRAEWDAINIDSEQGDYFDGVGVLCLLGDGDVDSLPQRLDTDTDTDIPSASPTDTGDLSFVFALTIIFCAVGILFARKQFCRF